MAKNRNPDADDIVRFHDPAVDKIKRISGDEFAAAMSVSGQVTRLSDGKKWRDGKPLPTPE